MLIDSRHTRVHMSSPRLMLPIILVAMLVVGMLAADAVSAQAATTAMAGVAGVAGVAGGVPLADEDIAVSTGSWYCNRYLEASAAPGSPQSVEILSSVRQFALGYVYGVSEAVGKPFPESSGNQRRILAMLEKACSEDTARAVRDATLLAGRAMLADGSATAVAPISTHARPGATSSSGPVAPPSTTGPTAISMRASNVLAAD